MESRLDLEFATIYAMGTLKTTDCLLILVWASSARKHSTEIVICEDRLHQQDYYHVAKTRDGNPRVYEAMYDGRYLIIKDPFLGWIRIKYKHSFRRYLQ